MNLVTGGLRAAACAAAVLAVGGASTAFAATHTIRIEGQTRTLLPETRVTVPDAGQIGPDVAADCEWNDPAGPLHVATAGNWDRSNFVKTILGETLPDGSGWFIWVNGKYAGGNCYHPITPGSDILFTAGPYDPVTFNPLDLPLILRDVPARVEPGKPFTVTVEEIQPENEPGQSYYAIGTGAPKPAAGATVTAGGATATTGADGRATLTVGASGPITVQAHRGNRASRSKPVETCATNGSDGACGTSVPQPPSTSDPAPARDLTAPVTTIAGIKDRATISARKAPRLLRGRVAEQGGILMVKVRLTRTYGGRCFAYSARRERFIRRPTCGADQGWWFRVGDRADWEYQLPRRLPRGRYVLDVKAIDRAYNREEARRRGENRVIFSVR